MERGPGGMEKKMRNGLENRERARRVLSVCAPGYVCLLLCVCNCLGGRVDVRPRLCARVCWSVSERLSVCVSCMCT